MKVKIVKCSSDRAWYRNEINKIYDVLEKEYEDGIYEIEKGNCRLILKADTIPVNEIRYEVDCDALSINCITSCKHIQDVKVGSVSCVECKYNCGNNIKTKTVLCSWQELEVGDTVVIEGFKGMKKSYVKEESKEMKRLDIRKDYKDSKIEIEIYNSDSAVEYSRIRLLDSSQIAIRIGEEYSTTIDQANAILKVIGLDYELYEATDWGKVEEGAEVTWIEECIVYKAPNGVLRRLGEFVKYIPDIKKIVVRVGDEVKVVEEDKVELC